MFRTPLHPRQLARSPTALFWFAVVHAAEGQWSRLEIATVKADSAVMLCASGCGACRSFQRARASVPSLALRGSHLDDPMVVDMGGGRAWRK